MPEALTPSDAVDRSGDDVWTMANPAPLTEGRVRLAGVLARAITPAWPAVALPAPERVPLDNAPLARLDEPSGLF
jgi:hypothetical protein